MAATYLITEPYDGSHVRILASARTKTAADRQFARERRARENRGYGYFSPIRRVIGARRAVEHMRDREVATLPTWESPDE